MLKIMRNNEKLGISAVKDCSVARFRQNLLPLAFELHSLPSSLSSFSVFESALQFRVHGRKFRSFRAILVFFGVVRPNLVEYCRGASGLAPQRCDSGHLGYFWALQSCGATFWAPRRCLVISRTLILKMALLV